jgi:hypothetical protein
VTAETPQVDDNTVTNIVHRYAGQIREQAADETTRRNAAALDRAGHREAAAYLRGTR